MNEAIRILLGISEAGFYAGSAFYFSWWASFLRSNNGMTDAGVLTSWYRRAELGFRLAIFNSAVKSAGAFGGLLSVRLRPLFYIYTCYSPHTSQAAISNMDGVGGKPAW